MEQAYSGTKHDVVLTGEQLADLIAGRSTYVQIGRWDDETPSFIRVTPPESSLIARAERISLEEAKKRFPPPALSPSGEK